MQYTKRMYMAHSLGFKAGLGSCVV